MSPEAIAAIGGLAFTVILAIATGAYHMGTHSNRIKNVEDRQAKTEAEARDATRDIGDLKTGMATLTGKFEGLESTVTSGFQTMAELITGHRRATPRTKRPG